MNPEKTEHLKERQDSFSIEEEKQPFVDQRKIHLQKLFQKEECEGERIINRLNHRSFIKMQNIFENTSPLYHESSSSNGSPSLGSPDAPLLRLHSPPNINFIENKNDLDLDSPVNNNSNLCHPDIINFPPLNAPLNINNIDDDHHFDTPDFDSPLSLNHSFNFPNFRFLDLNNDDIIDNNPPSNIYENNTDLNNSPYSLRHLSNRILTYNNANTNTNNKLHFN